MDKNKELAKNTTILFIGTFFTKIIQYFLLPIYTGFLNTTEYGTIELINTIIMLLVPIVGLEVDQGIFRFLIKYRNDNFMKKQLISSSFFFIILSNFFCLLLFLLINPLIKNEYKWLLVFNLFLTSLSSLLMQISRGLGENTKYSLSGVIISISTILFNILFLVGYNLKVDGMLYGSAIGNTIGIIYLFISLNLFKFLSVKYIKKSLLKELLTYSFPMIPNSISWWIFSSSDRVIISTFLGLSDTGLLSIVYKFSNIGIVIFNVFNISLTESIALHIDDEDIEQYFNTIYNSVGQFFISLCFLLISLIPLTFNILINPNFSKAFELIPIAILATIFQVLAAMLGTIYIAKSNTKSVAITSIIAAIINIVGDLAMVKFVGIYAAVVSTLIAYFILFIYRFMDIKRKYICVKIESRLFYNFILSLIVSCSLYYIKISFLSIINLILIIIISFMFNKENIKKILVLLKNKFKIL